MLVYRCFRGNMRFKHSNWTHSPDVASTSWAQALVWAHCVTYCRLRNSQSSNSRFLQSISSSASVRSLCFCDRKPKCDSSVKLTGHNVSIHITHHSRLRQNKKKQHLNKSGDSHSAFSHLEFGKEPIICQTGVGWKLGTKFPFLTHTS